MTRDDIIRMAREAGFCTLLPNEHIDGTGGIYVGDDDITDSLKRFTALVAAAENEACAQIADVAEPYQAADLIRATSRDLMPLFDDWGSIPHKKEQEKK
jgi:hypothetical protein